MGTWPPLSHRREVTKLAPDETEFDASELVRRRPASAY